MNNVLPTNQAIIPTVSYQQMATQLSKKIREAAHQVGNFCII